MRSNQLDRSRLGAAEVAKRLGITRQRVFILCREGRFAGAYQDDNALRSWRIPACALTKEVRLKNGRPRNVA